MSKIRVSNQQVIAQEFVSRLKNKAQVLAIFVGETGSGKSYSAIYIAQEMTRMYGTIFEPEDIVFTAIDFIKRFKQLQKLPDGGVGRIIVFDEAGVALNSRTSMSSTNVATGELFEMLRFSRISVFFTVPIINMLDITYRRLMHFVMIAQPIDRTTAPHWQRKLSTVRIYKVSRTSLPGEKESDFKTQHPVISVVFKNKSGESFVRYVKVPQMWLPLADKLTIATYEVNKGIHFRKSLDRAQRKLEKVEAKMMSQNCEIPPPRPIPAVVAPQTEPNRAIVQQVRAEQRSVMDELLGR